MNQDIALSAMFLVPLVCRVVVEAGNATRGSGIARTERQTPEYIAGEKRNTEPVAFSSAVPTDPPSWALRPSAFDLWGRPRLTRAPCSVRAAGYAIERGWTRVSIGQNLATSMKFFEPETARS